MPTDTTLPHLPAPWDYCYEWTGHYGKRKFTAAHHNGRACDNQVLVFTADQMRDYATSALTAALARAAELEREIDALRADAVRYRIGAHGSCKRADGSELGMCWVAWVNPGGAGSVAKIEWVSDADVDAAIIKHLESVNLQAQEYAYSQEYARAAVAADLGHQAQSATPGVRSDGEAPT